MNGMISGKTIVCGIIGDPIEHTMSPAMHNAAFQTLGLDYTYVPFRVKSLELKKAIEGIRGLNLRGLNVTIPHKVAVMQFLDRIDPLAEKIGAVNTIVNDDGILSGYNTDATGFLQTLHDKDVDPEDKKVLLLGAGGAARAIGNVLAGEKARITILNRRQELSWAEDLAHLLTRHYGAKVNIGELTPENLQRAIEGVDIVVNSTSLGMSPDDDQTPVPADLLGASLTVFDVVYNPYETRLLREAKAAGAKTINGLEMLVRQGAIAFEKWTGIKAPVDVMRQSALDLLQKNEK
jgi:shikimate dehydrogenase